MENKRITRKLGVGFYVAEHAHNTDEITYKLGILEDKLEHWLTLLQTDGINSKKIVADEIREVLNEQDN